MKFAMLVIMVLLMGGGMKYGQRYIMQAAGLPAAGGSAAGPLGVEAPQFSSEESDLMSTVFKSAIRLFTGSATRNELASELSDKLYSGRAGAGNMAELGIELVKPGEGSPVPDGLESAPNSRPGGELPNLPPGAKPPVPPPGAKLPNSQPITKSPHSPPGATSPNAQPGAKLPAKPGARPGESPAPPVASKVPTGPLAQFWKRAKGYTLELALVPVALLVMYLVHRIRRRQSGEDAFLPPDMANLIPSDSEPFDMKNAVHSLKAEEFELLVALIYQRQGYRVSMPAGLSGGSGIDFTLARKAERVLVQCKRLNMDHKVPVERVRDLHEAVTTAGATRGMYVASCGFSWDARNFAKARGVTLINARILDQLITAAREKPDEDLLAVSQWVPKFMSKVQLTTPLCPACEATMDQVNVSDSSVWVCSQRPDCRGRRSARKHQKPVPAAARNADAHADGVNA